MASLLRTAGLLSGAGSLRSTSNLLTTAGLSPTCTIRTRSYSGLRIYTCLHRIGGGCRKPSSGIIPNHLYLLDFLVYSVRLAPMRVSTYARSRPIVKTTRTNETTRFTKADSTSPTFSVTPPMETVKSETPLPAAAAGERMGVRIPSDRAVKNLETTDPR